MKVHATTIEQFFTASSDYEDDLRRLDQIVQRVTGEKPHLCDGMASITMLGYTMGTYKPASAPKSQDPTPWPVIAIAPQKNYISIYISAIDDAGQYLAGKYASDLQNPGGHKVSVGKSCVRFKSIDDLNVQSLESLLKEAASRSVFGS